MWNARDMANWNFLTSSSRSRSWTPFWHFCTSPVEVYPTPKISFPALCADFDTHIHTAYIIHTRTCTNTCAHAHHPITARAIYSSRCKNVKRQAMCVSGALRITHGWNIIWRYSPTPDISPDLLSEWCNEQSYTFKFPNQRVEIEQNTWDRWAPWSPL